MNAQVPAAPPVPPIDDKIFGKSALRLLEGCLVLPCGWCWPGRQATPAGSWGVLEGGLCRVLNGSSAGEVQVTRGEKTVVVKFARHREVRRGSCVPSTGRLRPLEAAVG
jgi:hypothetical protein